jgi:RNA polymerase sigma factor (sigma-70 family)
MKETVIDSHDMQMLDAFANDLKDLPVLSTEEELYLAVQARKGDIHSRNHLIQSNLKFVIREAYKYWYPGLPLMDMISGGYMSLIRASETFDPTYKVRFISYAGSAVSHGIWKVITQHKLHDHDSLDEFTFDDGEETLKDRLEGDLPDPGERVYYDQFKQMLNELTKRERMVVRLRFWHDLTLEETGKCIGLGKERTRQTEKKALRKLRWAILALWNNDELPRHELQAICLS